MATFRVVYGEELKRAVSEHPEEYAYGVERVPVVADRMVAALKAGNADVKSRAVKATCKRLGIKATVGSVQTAAILADQLPEAAAPELLGALQAIIATADSGHETGHSESQTVAGNWDVLGPRIRAATGKD